MENLSKLNKNGSSDAIETYSVKLEVQKNASLTLTIQIMQLKQNFFRDHKPTIALATLP